MRTTASPILSALYRGDREEAEKLAETSRLDLFEAAALGRPDGVKEALGKSPHLASATTDDGFTALHLAAFFSADVACARLLLNAGTDVNALADNETGLRPINSAAAAGSSGIVKLLLGRGADVDAIQNGGFTPLHSAAANGNAELVSVLLDFGADRTRTTDDGRTAQALANERGHAETARLLD